MYALEGADIGIIYLNEHDDANMTKSDIEKLGHRCLLLAGDVGNEEFCKYAVTQVISYFYLSKAALPHLTNGSVIINTTSITAYEGHELLMDYAASKGAIVSFTRSLSQTYLLPPFFFASYMAWSA